MEVQLIFLMNSNGDTKQMITLELSIEETQIVLAGLGKLPLEVAANTFNKVKKQAEEQVNKPKE